eukprot:COSAG02_NODE_369_length_23680_cov_36.650609_9_plen_121_part_00
MTISTYATAVIDGLLYAIGGSDSSSYVSSGERFDPATNAWSPIASMGTARYAHAAAVIDGLLYAIGGSDGSSYVSSGERFDLATKRSAENCIDCAGEEALYYGRLQCVNCGDGKYYVHVI